MQSLGNPINRDILRALHKEENINPAMISDTLKVPLQLFTCFCHLNHYFNIPFSQLSFSPMLVIDIPTQLHRSKLHHITFITLFQHS